MPIYVYECPTDGKQDVFSRTFNVPRERPCPVCGRSASVCVTAPSRHDIKRDWDEKANEYRRDPYTQSKAQLTNQYRSEMERVERDCDRPPNPVTEEAIQVGAREIHKQTPRPDPQQRQLAHIRKARRKEREVK
jgi:hypothetical protein